MAGSSSRWRSNHLRSSTSRSKSPVGEINPQPAVMISGPMLASEAIAGRPHAIASSKTNPNPSANDGNTNTWDFRYQSRNACEEHGGNQLTLGGKDRQFAVSKYPKNRQAQALHRATQPLTKHRSVTACLSAARVSRIYKPQWPGLFVDCPWCPEFNVDSIRCPSDVLVRVEFANSGRFDIPAGNKRKVRQLHFFTFLLQSHYHCW